MANFDPTALFKIGYGLYVVTTNDGNRDNGLIVNTVTQVADQPLRIAVSVNKANYSHDVILSTRKMNVNCLDETAPFSVFENFGFRSGRTEDKFAGLAVRRSENGLRVLTENVNAFFSLEVENYVDMGSHGLFICTVTEGEVLEDTPSMTYAYYHENVKPNPNKTSANGYVCRICGWVYEGETLPEDIVCPLCKHGAADFEPL